MMQRIIARVNIFSSHLLLGWEPEENRAVSVVLASLLRAGGEAGPASEEKRVLQRIEHKVILFLLE